ncbi:3-hydroxyisobutyrate dehydrogenase [Zopfochytrium polystomum]|nr:3-hydroxyisobutyrate dehydrogenase [Zopfochytrium polystomum]
MPPIRPIAAVATAHPLRSRVVVANTAAAPAANVANVAHVASRRALSIPAKPTIGFIGLGQMGFPMAANLLAKTAATADAHFHVFDAHLPTAKRFKEESSAAAAAAPTVVVHDSPRSLAKECDVIVSMLPEGKHAREVYLDDARGVLAGLDSSSSALLVDSSTIDVPTSKYIAAAAAASAAKAVYIDAPVSGGTLGAKAATLTFMTGAPSQAVFDAAEKEVLRHMGAKSVWCGDVGNGLVAKICNNMLLGISMIAASETMNLGVRMGMDPKLLASILNSSSGRCWSTDTYNPCPGVLPNVPASRDYEGGFGSSLMAKDLGLALDAAQDAKAAVTLGAVAAQVYRIVAATEGLEKKDFSVVYRWLGGKEAEAAGKQ